MSDNAKRGTAHALPTLSPQRMPARSSVHLPASGGAWLGTRTALLKKDAHFVRTHADFLDARTTQAKSAQACVDARIELARSIARLDWLPEILEVDYLCGKFDRAHEIEMRRIAHQTAEVNARINLVGSQQHLASLNPHPEPPPVAPTGLTPDDVDELLSNFPDLTVETRHLVALALKGQLKEKMKDKP